MADNRTSEFLSLAQGLPGADRLSMSSSSNKTSLSSGLGGGGAGSAAAAARKKETSNNPAYQELRNFHTTAAGISKDIASTSALLTELTNLVRHGPAFDGGSEQQQMNQLVVRIKTSIENLNARLDDAARASQQQKRRLGQQAGQEAANTVDGLQTVFAEAASDFKKVLQQRTESMKEQTDFQKSVYDTNGSSQEDDNPMPNMSALAAPPPVYTTSTASGSSFGGAGNHHFNAAAHGGGAAFPTLDLTSGLMSAGEATSSSALPRPHGIASTGGARGSEFRQRRSNSGDAGFSSHSSSFNHAPYGQTGAPLTPLDIQRMEEETGASQQMQLIPDQDYLQQRADAMSTVETNIVELGTIFNKLAVMVNEHRDMVQRVDDNVQDANTNINMSMQVLTDTLHNLRTNRMLALRVFSVLVLFIIAFIIFFA